MTESRRPGPVRPPVRLRPAPSFDPPCVEDDPTNWPTHGQLALDLFEVTRSGVVRPPNRRRRPGPIPGRPGPAVPPSAMVTATPDATRAAHRFVATCLEVVNGYRPPRQLRPLFDPARAVDLLSQVARATGRSGPVRRRSTRPATHLRRLRVCEPRSGVVEAAAVLTGPAGRVWAMAFRLDHRRGKWVCSALQVL
ncbi:Rv3235 family protein [Micromonospora sp. WMMA1363]|uniref:Rv3235 family protein n=1 Tax=Micromonospora sp. WMMA1363 TaxID=3053985 RepID=UPI00259C6D97|nr:Rv3235 family protein [Micromonospora sp. WMMA1363]MDM4722621.1 Rv3235 family protein [Micromonospora sp. WMMA1363]